MFKEITEKAVNGGAIGLIAYITGFVNQLCYVLLIFIVCDYITGIIADVINGKKFKKDVAIKGIIKKSLYAVGILAGVLIDYIIVYATQTLGFSFTWGPIFGIGLLLYYTGTEVFSLMQNLIECGIDMPNFAGLVTQELQSFLTKGIEEGGKKNDNSK